MCLYRDMMVILCVYIGTWGWWVGVGGGRGMIRCVCLNRDIGVIRRVCIGT